MNKAYNIRMVACTLVNIFHALICIFVSAMHDYLRDIMWIIYLVIFSINLTLILLLAYTKRPDLKVLLKDLRKSQLVVFIMFSLFFYPWAIFS
jgi:hypothetical protein